MSRKKVYFLHSNIGQQLTGVEKSAMKRGNMFVKYLEVEPVFVTVNKNTNIHTNWERYIANGIVDKNISMINLFEYFQRSEEGKELPPFQIKREQAYGYENETSNGKFHVRMFDTNNNLVKYIIYRSNNQLDYINYFDSGKKIVRDRFNRFGQLSHTEYLRQDNTVYMTEYFDVYGKRVITKYEDGPYLISDENSVFKAVLPDEQALILYFLKKIIDQEEHVVIIDRNKRYSSLFIENKQLNVKTISVFHSTFFSNTTFRSKVNKNYKEVLNSPYSFDNIVVLTNNQKRDIEKQYGIQNLTAIPHPCLLVDTLSEKKPTVNKLVSVSRLAPEKNIDHLLEIIAIVKKHIPDVLLEIYGGGKEQQQLKKLAQRLELKDNVKFNGYVDKVEDVYASSELFLFAGQAEGFTMSVLESLACGCPVGSYNVRYGVDEMIQEDENGFLITFGDKEKFAEKIVAYLNKSNDEKNTYRQKAIHSATDYTEDKVANKWKELLNNLI
ncbi:glycosyltransferase [Oceanobacillus sojae]|uniref:Glycosyl transferase family 1 n=1 Tax=Oceanobacillus sojae TaxID=582851 RepID=A0A511ZNT8_9BACI|nr:glycosyltransferase [Oceanobacillus sojae]GEN89122.1 glycosyl transferase family 1 [Oceanobacillus sojae]